MTIRSAYNIGFVGLTSISNLMSDVDAALASMLARGDIAELAARAGMTYLPPRQPAIRKHILLSDLKGPWRNAHWFCRYGSPPFGTRE